MSTDEIAFMGRITAGMSHELRNVLAVIGESAGLMEDLLAISEDDPSRYRERLDRIIGRILQQVRRGTVLVGGLNRFAHSSEERRTTVDVDALLDQLVVVTTWFGREKRALLRVRRTDPSPKVLAGPMKLQMMVFAALEAVLSLTPAVESVELAADTREGAVGVVMALEGPRDSLSQWDSRIKERPAWVRVGELARELDARLEVDGPAYRARLWLGPLTQFETK